MEPAFSGSWSAVWFTFTPIPRTTAPSRASARQPAIFLRLSITSFGHLSCTERPSVRSSVSATAMPATRESCGAGGSGGGFSRTEKRSAVPAGASQLRPSRPRPAVWWSATTSAPSGSDVSTSSCVDSQDSTSSRGSPSLGTRQRLDPHGADLVFGGPDERVADVVGQPVDLRLGEVQRHPDETGVDALRVVRLRLELASSGDEPRNLAIRYAERSRVLGMDLEERCLLLVRHARLAHRHVRRVVVIERPAGREHERVLGVRLLDRRLILDGEEAAAARRQRRPRRVQVRG